VKTNVVAVIAFVATIFAANWAIVTFGVIPVGGGFMAPAGVYFVGLAFPLRDFIQRRVGRRAAFACVIGGALLSYFIAPRLAIASGFTFLVSETIDTLVYTLLQKRFALAVVFSCITALVVDSALFLWLAFGSETFLLGQIVGKSEASAFGAVLVILLAMRRERYAVLPRHA